MDPNSELFMMRRSPSTKHIILKRLKYRLALPSQLNHFESIMMKYRTWCLQAEKPLYEWLQLSPELMTIISPELSSLLSSAGSKYRSSIIVEIRRSYVPTETSFNKSFAGIIHIIKNKTHLYFNPDYKHNPDQKLITETWLKYSHGKSYIKSIRTTYKTHINDNSMYRATNELKLPERPHVSFVNTPLVPVNLIND